MTVTLNEAERQLKPLRAGVIGLGMIGGGVAVSLARSGRAPVVYDIRTDASAKLTGVDQQLESPAAVAARSDVVMVAVVDAAQVDEVINGPGGLLEGTHAGLVVALLSTVDLAAVRSVSDQCAAVGVALLDCGVTPGDKAAENGMVAMVGGDADSVARARPVLEDWAAEVVHCGPTGAGMAVKIARNMLTYCGWAVADEASALAEAAGVPLSTLLEVLRKADSAKMLLLRLELKDQGYQIPDEAIEATVTFAKKDLAAAKRLAAEFDLPTPLVDTSRRHMRTVIEGSTHSPAPEDAVARGRELMDRVYGPGTSAAVPAEAVAALPAVAHTVGHLFADVWSRPALSIRDRRLLVLGAAALLGRGDLAAMQVRVALANDELTVEELREIVLHLHYYVGWPNATSIQDAIEGVLATAEVD